MRHLLPLIPPVLVLLGATAFNRVTPFVLGVPSFFAWTVLTVVATSLTMLAVYRLDPRNRRDGADR